MERIEEEYRKILELYPNANTVKDSIFHIKIPLINNVFLDIDYKKYPSRPKVVLSRTDGQIYKNIELIISILKNWKKKDAPSIVEIVNEIFTFVKNLESDEIFIKGELLSGIMALCREQHPREILGLLRVESNIITEFILPPGALTSTNSGIFFPSRLPLDPSLQGTVHSHPSGNPNPSLTDLNEIFNKKRFHIIIGYPYKNSAQIKCFNKSGKELNLRIVD